MLPESTAREAETGEMQGEMGFCGCPQRSYTLLLDSLREHLAGFTCVFTPESEEEWEFTGDSPLSPPYHLSQHPQSPEEKAQGFLTGMESGAALGDLMGEAGELPL
jgi:hypothetical protein